MGTGLNYDSGKARGAAEAPTPAMIALYGWVLPGLGYWVIGQRSRGVTIGVTVLVLFLLGLLIGGVRVIEVPTFSRTGVSAPGRQGEQTGGYLWREITSKPWSVAQVMMGPAAIAGGMVSVKAAAAGASSGGYSRGESHARINEIAVLYTAVAGMLNLLAIIDAAHRAAKLSEAK